MKYSPEYYDLKWAQTIKLLPKGGAYRYDMRQASYDIIKGLIPNGSKVFDFACGLGIIDIQLCKEKDCRVYGCDFSAVAVEYVNMNISGGEFKHTDEIFGSGYDFILAIAYLEHTDKPLEWIEQAFKYGETIIATIPNNFRKTGEHEDMQWSSWAELDKLLEGYKVEKITDYKNACHSAWQSPILIINKGDSMHPSYLDSSTGEKAVEPKEVKKVAKKMAKKVIETLDEEKPKRKRKKKND